MAGFDILQPTNSRLMMAKKKKADHILGALYIEVV